MFNGVPEDRGPRGQERGWIPCVCTTPWQVSSLAEERLAYVASWFQCPAVARRQRNIAQVLQDEHASVVIVADTSPKLYHRENSSQPLFFHPGMAQQRIARLQQGLPDRLISAAGIRQGDWVVDATLGLGTDSLVVAQAVGETGGVLALEASPLLARLFLYAKQHVASEYAWLQPLLERIEVVIGGHTLTLEELADESADVVLFDPMFRHPPDRQSSLDSVRHFALPFPLEERAWQEAKRVARRAVVLKERPTSGEFARFSLAQDKPRARFAYGVWFK